MTEVRVTSFLSIQSNSMHIGIYRTQCSEAMQRESDGCVCVGGVVLYMN